MGNVPGQPIAMQDPGISNRKPQVDGKNPAKSLNATINLEQMLNGSKSSRILPQPQRNSINASAAAAAAAGNPAAIGAGQNI